MPYQPIRKLPANSRGKDYIVGDLHGCHEMLMRLLNAVQFNKKVDRLLSVGDLIDRGPESMRCLHLLKEPWFYAVSGNHEVMMLECFQDYIREGLLDELVDRYDTGFLDYGGDWIRDEFNAKRRSMSKKFNQGLALAIGMPLILIIGENDSRFHIVHAELLNPGYQESKQPVWLDSDIDQWFIDQSIPRAVVDGLLWGRKIMSSELTDLPSYRFQKGLSPTFCGHTYNNEPKQALSHTCLDTGGFLAYMPNRDKDDLEDFGLTLLDVKESRWVKTSLASEEISCGKLLLRQSN